MRTVAPYKVAAEVLCSEVPRYVAIGAHVLDILLYSFAMMILGSMSLVTCPRTRLHSHNVLTNDFVTMPFDSVYAFFEECDFVSIFT